MPKLFTKCEVRVGVLARAQRSFGPSLEWLKDLAANSLYARRVGAWFVSKDRQGPKVTERLGFSSNARLLIINADDFGLCREQNLGYSAGLETGILTSVSLMPPCPGFDQACEYALRHDKTDVGIHLTLTSEWETGAGHLL